MACKKDDIQILDYGGCGEMIRYIGNLSRDDAVARGDVKGVLITGDKDTFSGKKPYQLQTELKKIGHDRISHGAFSKTSGAAIEKIGLYLLPDNEIDGALETLLLRTVSQDEVAMDARSFVERHFDKIAPENDKRVSQAYLAAKKGKLARGAGNAAALGHFDLSNSALNDLTAIIRKLLE